MNSTLFYPSSLPLFLTALTSDLCGRVPAGVCHDSVVLRVLHAALLPAPAHLVEVRPSRLRSHQSGAGEFTATHPSSAINHFNIRLFYSTFFGVEKKNHWLNHIFFRQSGNTDLFP